MGARYLSSVVGVQNWVCTDMGGTSFDVGLIRGGQPVIEREVVINGRIYNIPTLQMDTIGAGTGMYVTIDPITRRITIGPESSGADPGPVCYEMGNDVPTVMDCVLIMGILNPDNYLGGKKKLNKEKALRAVKEKCADVLGVDPYYFADGVYKLINSRMKEHIRSVLYARGFSPADFNLLCFGGAGPDASRRVHRRPALPRRGHHALGRRFLLFRLCRGGYQPPLPEVHPGPHSSGSGRRLQDADGAAAAQRGLGRAGEAGRRGLRGGGTALGASQGAADGLRPVRRPDGGPRGHLPGVPHQQPGGHGHPAGRLREACTRRSMPEWPSTSGRVSR